MCCIRTCKYIFIFKKNDVIISLDSSGESLHHRGYRSATNIAPINEVLAAGMLMMSGWEGQCDFSRPDVWERNTTY
ncbi:hypothetical protein CCAN12_520013 [Capnocytophaga canimorsus]|uniref:Ribosomal RNA large subunit methyltransferase K/L-like methyltransferase domain-containing protein n=1 Tax=Capnocytophaga canimorsus TaxID=28188 RepID=A0A0B7H9J1_9FLAO|nr:hypothetical protein CCAN12_520013 [Capnocytophaga canimorsus]